MKFNPVVDVRYFKHSDGRVIYVTYINDKPLTAIPEGFTQTDTPVEQKVGKEAEDATAAAARANAGAGSGGGGGIDQPVDARTAAFFDNETKEQRDDRMGKVNDFLQQVVNVVVPGAGLINALPSIISSPVVGAIANAFGSRQDPNLAEVEDAVPRSVADIRGQTESPFNREEAVRQAAQESFRFTELNQQNADAQEEAQAEAARQAAQESFRFTELTQQNQDSTPSGGGDFGGSGYDGGMFSGAQSGDVGFAKGGFIKKKKNVVKSKRGLASR